MKMQRVESSNIHSTGHEGDTMHIAFKLKDGSIGETYAYTPVSAGNHVKLRAAKSVGGHLNKMGIKGVKLPAEHKRG
jgi:hypothetical protein